MSVTLVDSNIFLDIFTKDPQWWEWSNVQLKACARGGLIALNPIVYAELSVAFPTKEELDIALGSTYVKFLDIPWQAAFLAGQAFKQYRRQGGSKISPIADFFIGAHASVEGFNLLTRDKRSYGTYFPKLRIISPKS